MDCKKAKILLAPHILGDLNDDPQRCRELQAHLLCCADCAEMYEGFQKVIGFVRNHKAEFAQALKNVRARELKKGIVLARPERNELAASIIRPNHVYKPKVIVKERDRYCSDFKESAKKLKRLQLFLRIGAVAACLVFGILTWMVFSNYSKLQVFSQNSSSQQVASVPQASVKVELVKPTSNIAIDTSHTIVADNELKTLLINGKHQMIIDAGTSLAIEPISVNAQLGCVVKLIAGEIYTHVEHDGNPFVVNTANGKAVITGTTFDIKATKDDTTLVVNEGTVCFESEKGTVNVAAGQKSEIVGQSAPSIPLSCNTYELTAWATGYNPNAALAQDRSDDIDLYLTLSLRTDPIVLVKTDYDYWVNDKRNWFKTNFPWIFELKGALAREGIEVDYPELLIKSSDVWQFVSSQRFPGRFSVPDFESLLKTVISYGFDRGWLLENVPIAERIQDKSLLLENLTGLATLDQLPKYANGTKAMPYYLYPADIGRYLTETRSLIWFAVNAGEFNLTDEQRVKVLDLLQQEVTTATNCCNDLLYPEDEKKKPLCGDKCETPETNTVGYIEMIYSLEKEIVMYGIVPH